jgi:hypothetical protein
LAIYAILDGAGVGSLACAGIEYTLCTIEPCIVLTCCSCDSTISLIGIFARLGDREGNY